jgi:hydrogenase maturation protease
MSSKCWQETLTAILTQPNKRLAIVGIGHELRGDDGVGVTIVRRLQETCSGSDSLLLLDAGSAPENCTGILRRFAPDVIVLLDAVEMQQEGVIFSLLTCKPSVKLLPQHIPSPCV